MYRFRRFLFFRWAAFVTLLFHRVFYEAGDYKKTWMDAYWMGLRIYKSPFDLWVYQEILFEKRPDLIIETGTANGGSALFLANMLDIIGSGQVISIDVESLNPPAHPRVTYLLGSSVSSVVVEQVRKNCVGKRVMVILDSNHAAEHVLQELDLYSPLVSPNHYLIVEDTDINGHPVHRRFGPGPWEAVQTFLHGHSNFRAERAREKFLMSSNPNGFLLKFD